MGLVTIAEGVEKLGEPPTLAPDSRLVLARVRELAAELEIIAGEGSQRVGRGAGSGARAARRIGRISASGRRCRGCLR